jgi:hypothetical protein
MNTQRLAHTLTAINLQLLLITLARSAFTSAQTVTPILRGRAFELVDDRGQVRSRFNVEPNGEVVLRLLDQKGTFRVKLGAAEGVAGLVLLDEATEPAVHIIARQRASSERTTTTSLTLRGPGGQQRVIKP